MFAAQGKREINDGSVCLHYKGKCGWRVNIMTGVFSADSQLAAEREEESESEKQSGQKERERSHQLMGAATIKSIFTLS